MSSTKKPPRRSTRSQSREVNAIESDGDVTTEVASTSSRKSNGHVSSRKPRASTRHVKKPETIDEDDLNLSRPIAGSSVSQSQIIREEEQEEQEALVVEEKEEEEEEVNDAVKATIVEETSSRPKKQLPRKVLQVLSKLAHVLPFLPPLLILSSFILGILLLSPNEPFARKVYVDENALQPGSATVEWGWSQVDLADRIADRIVAVADASADARAALLTRELQMMGLTAHNQSYSFQVPSSNGVKIVRGVNTYARFPAARGDGREALVLAANWKSAWDGSNDPDVKEASTRRADLEGSLSSYQRKGVRRTNVRGLASMIVLAKHLSGYGHWSKDLIFVFSDGEMEGMQAWTSSYFGREQSNLKSDRLQCGGSAIWNALAIDYPSDSFSHVVIKHEGLQGQLPNMDIINTFTRIAQKTNGLPVTLSASSEHDAGWTKEPLGMIGNFLEQKLWKDGDGAKKYASGLLNIVNQIGFLSTGRPSGIHGVFHRYHVDAITIYLRPASGPYGFYHIGRAMESMTRSMSNLLERLHHSQFFYLLTSPYRFIEVAKYLPVAALLSIALTIVGISIWLDEGKRSHQRKSTLVDVLRAVIEEEKEEEEDNINDVVREYDASSTVADTPLEHPTAAQLLSTFINLLVNRSLQRGDLLGTSKLRSSASLMQVLGRPILSATALIVSCHIIGTYAYYIIVRAPVDCAMHGIEQCKPLRLISTISTLSTLLVVWRIQRSNTKLLAERLHQCRAQLPESIVPFLLTFQAFRGKAIARTAYSFVIMETGMLILAISLVNFSLAIVFGLLLCIPMFAFRLPPSTLTTEYEVTTITTEIERSVSPVSTDTDNVEILTQSMASNRALTVQMKVQLWLQSVCFLLLSPFSLLYLAKLGLYLAYRLHSEACSSTSTWLDWSFDDALLQHHLLGTLTLPFVTLIYLPVVLVAFAANCLAAFS